MSETPKKTPKTVIAGIVIIVLIIAAGVAYYFTQTSPSGPTMTTNSQSMTSAAPLKIAMILPGRIDDLAWNQAGYASFEDLLTAQGQGINTCGCWIQNHQEKAQIEADIADLVSKGFNLIIGHGFEFQVPVQEVAPQYPNVNFLIVAGWNNSLPNTAIADVRTDQTGYVLGYLAGSMTKTDKIGYIMGARVAELARFEPNFAKGAHDANAMITYTYGSLPGGGNGIQPGEASASSRSVTSTTYKEPKQMLNLWQAKASTSSQQWETAWCWAQSKAQSTKMYH
jgi:basic membrane lipoprotein Med (substrate-binding protein (PBP1-ABC) superfamily)